MGKNNIMYIYLIEQGELGYGSDIIHVCLTKKKAKELVKKHIESDPDHCGFGPWTIHPDKTNYWESGCDFIRIFRRRVEE